MGVSFLQDCRPIICIHISAMLATCANHPTHPFDLIILTVPGKNKYYKYSHCVNISSI
jgi:hypothetical protein